MKTSKLASASFINSPFLFRPSPSGELSTRLDPKEFERNDDLYIRQVAISSGQFLHLLLGFIQKLDHLFAVNGREPFQKVVDGVARFQIIYQRLRRYARSGKNRRSALTSLDEVIVIMWCNLIFLILRLDHPYPNRLMKINVVTRRSVVSVRAKRYIFADPVHIIDLARQ